MFQYSYCASQKGDGGDEARSNLRPPGDISIITALITYNSMQMTKAFYINDDTGVFKTCVSSLHVII